jgi:UDP-galactopyranose mutase
MRRAAPDRCDVLVVGAGFAGAVLAERLASDLGLRVLVIDRRPHVAGNAHDRVDDHGIRVHDHGPHLFHTNSTPIFEYLSRFTSWTPYEHRVLASVDGQLVPIPINQDTINRLYGLSLDSAGVERFLEARAEPIDYVRTSEDAVVARVGRELYEKFFRGYTRKLWKLDPSELAASVTGRIPTRTNCDDRYFTDVHQALPAHGYTAMFRRILDHPNIHVAVETEYEDVRDEVEHDHLVYTGPIDGFYGERFGPLPYRSLRFEWATVDTPGGAFFQPVTQVNYPNEHAYLRITEFRHLAEQRLDVSTLSYEFPADEGDPYYPVPAEANRELYRRYEALAAQDPHVTFVGRLARYQYLNMDQVVGQALATFEKLRPRLAAEIEARRSGLRPSD